MAFQPIVDVVAKRIYAYEALVRGPNGQPAATVFSRVEGNDLYWFDQSCRAHAVNLANSLGLVGTGGCLSVNFLPGSLYDPDTCIRRTLSIAHNLNFPSDRIIFEISETEEVRDPQFLRNVVKELSRFGFRIALDDFGAGYANLNLLADLSPDIIKLDMNLVRNLHLRPHAQAIVTAAVNICRSMRMDLVAEGVETMEEFSCLRTCGVRVMQGYLLAKPQFEGLPEFHIPEEATSTLSPYGEFHPGLHMLRSTGTH